MTVLAAKSIRRLCIKKGMISPFHERTVDRNSGCSYGLSYCGYDVRLDQDIVIHPAPNLMSFQLASTMEQFKMPSRVVGFVHDKSTWARMGLAVQNTVIEPGWAGYLTLEITNHSNEIIRLKQGTPIAQVVFHWLDYPATPYRGKYHNQERGPQAARYEK